MKFINFQLKFNYIPGLVWFLNEVNTNCVEELTNIGRSLEF
jgi:hypothetical protein